MSHRGRRPKPTGMKLLAGNPGRRPLNKREPKPKRSVPHCPKQLSAAAKREWQRIAKELAKLGLLSRIDRAALAAYCQAWGRWIEAEDKLKKHGVIVKSPNGFPVQSPYLNVANQAMKQMTRMVVEFGMTPSSRSGVQALPPAEQGNTGGFDFNGPGLVPWSEARKRARS